MKKLVVSVMALFACVLCVSTKINAATMVEYALLCVDEKSLIQLSNGELLPIGEVKVGDSILVGTENRSAIVFDVKRRKSLVIEITTTSNKTVLASYEHQFVTNKGNIAAKNLVLGQPILTKSGFELIKKISIFRKKRNVLNIALTSQQAWNYELSHPGSLVHLHEQNPLLDLLLEDHYFLTNEIYSGDLIVQNKTL